MPTERSMSKEEFEEIAEATLEQYGVNGYKVVLLDSPVDAIIEAPELTQADLKIEAYTGEHAIYFLWYKLKHTTYTHQLNTIRHETAHVMQKTSFTNKSGLRVGDMNEWRDILSDFSVSHEIAEFHDDEEGYSDALVDYILSNRTDREARKNISREEKYLLESVKSFFKSFEDYMRDVLD